MRILGLYLRKMDHLVSKNLQPGWFPFGSYKEPMKDDYVVIGDDEDKMRMAASASIYKLKGGNTPSINVSCIVGGNGSGKSSLLDIMFRIINNIAFHFLIETNATAIEQAHGIDADLHFETDGVAGMARCSEGEYHLYWGKTNDKKLEEIKVEEKGLQEALSHFFHTICINYSIYAFHTKDYSPSQMTISKWASGINGKWLERMFHKNDGYLMPIVLNPFRDKAGNIDMERERKLSMQRLTSLILLFYLNGKQFIPGYYPNEISWKYNQNYLKDAKDKLYKEYYEAECGRDKYEHKLSDIYQRWVNYLKTKGYKDDKLEEGMYKASICYLSYKTLKICNIYSEYKKIYEEGESATDAIDTIIEKIHSTHDHVTVKIHQCLHYLIIAKYSKKFTHKDVDSVFGAYKGKVDSYDNMMKLLPPSFFDIDMDMCKQRKLVERNGVIDLTGGAPNPSILANMADRFTLGTMSSGERQFLNSMSSALYHIKNIESVKTGHNRVHYSHINLVLDEAELYYHPEYQRKYIENLLELLSWCNFDNKKIKSINILLVTHSPFILSDVMQQNILYLENGRCINNEISLNPFAANINTILRQSFFLKDGFVGSNANKRIHEQLQMVSNADADEAKFQELERVVTFIGDPFLEQQIKTYLAYRQTLLNHGQITD